MLSRNMLKVGRLCQQAARLYAEEAGTTKTVKVLTGERGVNKVFLIGRVGNKPEVRGTDEKTVTILSVATSQSYRKPSGDYVQKTEWHRVAIFRPGLKQYCAQVINKGDHVHVDGSLTYQEYEGQSGKVRSCSIVADDLIVLHKKNAQTSSHDVITDS